MKYCLICQSLLDKRHKKYCSKKCHNLSKKGQLAWNKGICHLSPEAKKRISMARKKWYKTHAHPKGFKGKLHSQDERNQIAKSLLQGKNRISKVPQGYQYGHSKVRLARGKPKICLFCRKHKKNHPKLIFDWANLTKNYHNPNDYVPACRSCHNRFDKKIIKLPKNYAS